jgi:hypothetical protein
MFKSIFDIHYLGFGLATLVLTLGYLSLSAVLSMIDMTAISSDPYCVAYS